MYRYLTSNRKFPEEFRRVYVKGLWRRRFTGTTGSVFRDAERYDDIRSNRASLRHRIRKVRRIFVLKSTRICPPRYVLFERLFLVSVETDCLSADRFAFIYKGCDVCPFPEIRRDPKIYSILRNVRSTYFSRAKIWWDGSAEDALAAGRPF